MLNTNIDPCTPQAEPTPISELTLVRANEEQILAFHEEAYKIWSFGLSFDAYVGIADEEQAHGGWAENNGDTIWVLVERSDPNGAFYSACEIHRIKALMKRKGSNVVEDVVYYGVVYVVTPPPLQRNGYATHMLRLLHYVLGDPTRLPPFPTARWGPPPARPTGKEENWFPPAAGMLLTSDIGTDFYRRCTVGLDRPGWEAKEEWQDELVWRIKPPVPTPVDPRRRRDRKWTTLYEADMPAVIDLLSRLARGRVQSTDTSSRSAFTPDPASTGILTFAAVRGSYGPQPAWRKAGPQPLGIRMPRTSSGPSSEVDAEDSIILFSIHTAQVGPRFLVTFVHNIAPEDLDSALAAMDQVLAEQGSDMTEGWVWGLDQQSSLVRAWQEMADRQVHVGKRIGDDCHLISWCFYNNAEDQVQVLDTQLWTWL